MRKNVITTVVAMLVSVQVFARSGNDEWPVSSFSGYESTVLGGGFIYHSPNLSVTSSMLVRSADSTAYVEWKTQRVPADFGNEYADFAWMFGINVTPDGHLFSLYVNGMKILSFTNPVVSKKTVWSVKGRGGAEITFIPTMIDMYHDLMGYAFLKLPAKYVKKGEEQVVRIHGQSTGSRVWYMTFETPVREEVNLNQIPAVVKRNGKLYDIVEFTITHLGEETRASITLDNGRRQSASIRPGYNSLMVRIPEISERATLKAKTIIDGQTFSNSLTVKPVRHWTVYLVQHTHTDVGYAEANDEIMAEQLRYIDYALDFCRDTDNFPPGAKFKWTCETAWAVKQYLLTRPKSQVDRLLRRIKQGRIEVTGLYLNMLDLVDESSLADMMRTVKYFRRHGIDVKTAMQDDVGDAPWCLVDYLSSAGVRYFALGQNPGHARRPFDKPTAFWWESPSGNRILAFRGEHYQYGNMLGLLSGDMRSFGNSLFLYLNNLAEKGYRMNMALLQFSGYFIDDSPPSVEACDLVKKWDDTFEWPKLKLATIGEFMSSVEKHYGPELPAYRLAWPGWWSDGVGSCALETAYIRDTQSGFIANEGLLSMAHLLGAKVTSDALRAMNVINDDITFFDEHTFGANESISNPLSLNSTVQWNEKSAYAWKAVEQNRLLRETSLGFLRHSLSKMKFPTVTVFNTLNTERSGVAQFFAYDDLMPPDKKITIIDSDGNKVPVQLAKSGPGGNYWDIFVKHAPSFGYETYRVIVGAEPPTHIVERRFSGVLENKYYKIVIDTVRGGITSLIDRSSNRDLVDSKAPWEFGQFIYERLANRRLLEGPGAMKYNPDLFRRTSMTDVRVGKMVDGPIWESLDVRGQVKGCADSEGVACEIRLFKYEKRIQLVFSMIKRQVFKPEAVYVAFPLRYPGSHVAFDVQGGTVIPGKGQLPGTASDWDYVQNFATVQGEGGQIILASPEAPLMEFGGINTGKWLKVNDPKKPYIYSYVLNNYWDTNYKAAQEGGLRWTYDITSSSDTTMQFATQFGWGMCVPLIATFMPGEGNGSQLVSHSVLNFPPGSLLLVFARPAWDGKGIVLCLRETDGKMTSLNTSELLKLDSSFRIYEINSLEDVIKQVTGKLSFKPYQVRFLLIRQGT